MPSATKKGALRIPRLNLHDEVGGGLSSTVTNRILEQSSVSSSQKATYIKHPAEPLKYQFTDQVKRELPKSDRAFKEWAQQSGLSLAVAKTLRDAGDTPLTAYEISKRSFEISESGGAKFTDVVDELNNDKIFDLAGSREENSAAKDIIWSANRINGRWEACIAHLLLDKPGLTPSEIDKIMFDGKRDDIVESALGRLEKTGLVELRDVPAPAESQQGQSSHTYSSLEEVSKEDLEEFKKFMQGICSQSGTNYENFLFSGITTCAYFIAGGASMEEIKERPLSYVTLQNVLQKADAWPIELNEQVKRVASLLVDIHRKFHSSPIVEFDFVRVAWALLDGCSSREEFCAKPGNPSEQKTDKILQLLKATGYISCLPWGKETPAHPFFELAALYDKEGSENPKVREYLSKLDLLENKQGLYYLRSIGSVFLIHPNATLLELESATKLLPEIIMLGINHMKLAGLLPESILASYTPDTLADSEMALVNVIQESVSGVIKESFGNKTHDVFWKLIKGVPSTGSPAEPLYGKLSDLVSDELPSSTVHEAIEKLAPYGIFEFDKPSETITITNGLNEFACNAMLGAIRHSVHKKYGETGLMVFDHATGKVGPQESGEAHTSIPEIAKALSISESKATKIMGFLHKQGLLRFVDTHNPANRYYHFYEGIFPGLRVKTRGAEIRFHEQGVEQASAATRQAKKPRIKRSTKFLFGMVTLAGLGVAYNYKDEIAEAIWFLSQKPEVETMRKQVEEGVTMETKTAKDSTITYLNNVISQLQALPKGNQEREELKAAVEHTAKSALERLNKEEDVSKSLKNLNTNLLPKLDWQPPTGGRTGFFKTADIVGTKGKEKPEPTKQTNKPDQTDVSKKTNGKPADAKTKKTAKPAEQVKEDMGSEESQNTPLLEEKLKSLIKQLMNEAINAKKANADLLEEVLLGTFKGKNPTEKEVRQAVQRALKALED